MARRKRTQTWAEMTAVSSKSATWILKNLVFVLFLGLVAMIYIANAHYAQSTVRDIKILQEELKEKRRIHNALNAEVMHKSKKAEIAAAVEHLGIKPSNQAPKKIIVKQDKE